MRVAGLTFLFASLLLVESVDAQVEVNTTQILTAEWVGVDCSRVCDQPSGTAGFRVIVDGFVFLDLPPVLPISATIDPLPGPGPHTLELEVYNCGLCPGGEQAVRHPIVMFLVVQSDPDPPAVPPLPVLTVTDP